MPRRHQRYGRKCEEIAARHLENNGYRILEKNYRTSRGEIDIIARDNDFIVFVEVKARQTDRYGNPKAAVTSDKQRKISMVALHYLKSTGQLTNRARFDVVAVHPPDSCQGIEIVKNAFDLCYF
jgi:putative endonuclease